MKGDIRLTIEKVRIGGSGVILLMGPSGCGKGEIARTLRVFLSIPEERHFSMGSILRGIVAKAKDDEKFTYDMAARYGISRDVLISDAGCNRPEVIKKAENYSSELKAIFRTGP